jgi:hypothetical protein
MILNFSQLFEMKYSALVRQATGNALVIAFQHEERISRFGSDTI